MMSKFMSRLRGFSHINIIKIHIKDYKYCANCHKNRKIINKSSHQTKTFKNLLENCLLLKKLSFE